MFASLTPDYFGENNNASNYGLIYSSKLLGSVVGIGVGASVIDAWGYTGAYWIAAVSALVSAGIALFLRQPGRRTTAEPRVDTAAPREEALSEPSLADLKAD
jgi:predicted MFS family arabinose efflux permease